MTTKLELAYTTEIFKRCRALDEYLEMCSISFLYSIKANDYATMRSLGETVGILRKSAASHLLMLGGLAMNQERVESAAECFQASVFFDDEVRLDHMPSLKLGRYDTLSFSPETGNLTYSIIAIGGKMDFTKNQIDTINNIAEYTRELIRKKDK